MLICAVQLLLQRVKHLSRPTKDWGPALYRNEMTGHKHRHASEGASNVGDTIIPLNIQVTIEKKEAEAVNDLTAKQVEAGDGASSNC